MFKVLKFKSSLKKYVDCTRLAAKRSAGFTLDVNLRNPLHSAETWLRKKRVNVTRSPKQGCLCPPKYF